MIPVLRIRHSGRVVPPEAIKKTYNKLRIHALPGVIFGYAAFYFVRNNFALSTPYLKSTLNLNTAEIGFLSSYMLIAYGISKGVMSSLADKADPKRYMALGLLLCALINVLLGVSSVYWAFAVLVILNGYRQGMVVGPCFISIAHWYPRKMRGSIGAAWNISHNIGGGLVAPIVGVGFVIFGAAHWQAATYWTPAIVAVLFAGPVLYFCKGSPVNEGLPSLQEMVPDEEEAAATPLDNPAEGMSAWQIFRKYVMFNRNAWLVSWMDVFVYAVRFGMISWIPLYLAERQAFLQNADGQRIRHLRDCGNPGFAARGLSIRQSVQRVQNAAGNYQPGTDFLLPHWLLAN